MIININDKINTIVSKDEKIIIILQELGFTDIVKPGMLNTVGRFVNLKTGSKLKHIDLDVIIKTLIEKGYQVIDE